MNMMGENGMVPKLIEKGREINSVCRGAITSQWEAAPRVTKPWAGVGGDGDSAPYCVLAPAAGPNRPGSRDLREGLLAAWRQQLGSSSSGTGAADERSQSLGDAVRVGQAVGRCVRRGQPPPRPSARALRAIRPLAGGAGSLSGCSGTEAGRQGGGRPRPGGR